MYLAAALVTFVVPEGVIPKDKADEWRKKLEETKAAAKPPAQP